MEIKHAVIYVPGLGDRNLSGRQTLLNTWHYQNVSIEICPMDWTVDEPWQTKLARLLSRIDELYSAGKHVSLIGESAGASAVINALAVRTDKLHAVVLLCGKSQYPNRVSPRLYVRNPAFKPALADSAVVIPTLTPRQKDLILNLHPLFDPTVPVQETKIPRVKNALLPSIGHATSIVIANTLWSWRIIRFIRSSGVPYNK